MTETSWWLRGNYFENCNCDVVCPCVFSPSAPMTSAPTEGACEVPPAFEGETIWASNAHPFATDALALAAGDEGSLGGRGTR